MSDFTVQTLRDQIESPHSQGLPGGPTRLTQLLLAYSEVLERELVSTLEDLYVEAGVGGVRFDIWLDRKFVKIRDEAAKRAGPA